VGRTELLKLNLKVALPAPEYGLVRRFLEVSVVSRPRFGCDSPARTGSATQR
jgi:hypothetical protein